MFKSRLVTDNLIYRNLRNKVIADLKKSKAFFPPLVKDAKGQSKMLWNTMDKLLGKRNGTHNNIQLKIEDVVKGFT